MITNLILLEQLQNSTSSILNIVICDDLEELVTMQTNLLNHSQRLYVSGVANKIIQIIEQQMFVL